MNNKEIQAVRERYEHTQTSNLIYRKAESCEDVPKLIEALGVAEMKKNVWVSKYTDACEQNKRLQEQIEQLRQERDELKQALENARHEREEWKERLRKGNRVVHRNKEHYRKLSERLQRERDEWKEKAEWYELTLKRIAEAPIGDMKYSYEIWAREALESDDE